MPNSEGVIAIGNEGFAARHNTPSGFYHFNLSVSYNNESHSGFSGKYSTPSGLVSLISLMFP
jgi:hypothetical protein